MENYIYCPACGSNVAIIHDSLEYGEIGYCYHDCGFKWIMLIEPNPETFSIENEEQTEIVLFEEDLDDIMYEDKERYQRILTYSDLSDTYNKKIPKNINIRRKKFFLQYFKNQEKELNKMFEKQIVDFINGNEKQFINIKYILSTVCNMKLIKEKNLLKTIKYTIYNNNALNLIITNEIKEKLFKKLINEYKINMIKLKD